MEETSAESELFARTRVACHHPRAPLHLHECAVVADAWRIKDHGRRAAIVEVRDRRDERVEPEAEVVAKLLVFIPMPIDRLALATRLHPVLGAAAVGTAALERVPLRRTLQLLP